MLESNLQMKNVFMAPSLTRETKFRISCTANKTTQNYKTMAVTIG